MKLVSAILLLLFWQLSCRAQILTPASQTGNPVNTSSIVHGVDSVNTMGLGLHIEIPLFSVQERGRTLTYSYVYNSPTYDIMFFPAPTSQNQSAGFWTIEVPGAGGRPGGPDNWQLVRPDSWYFMYDTQMYDTKGNQLVCDYTFDGNSSSVNYEIQSNFRLVDPEGTQHPLSMTATEYLGSPPVGKTCGPTNVLASPTLDGSGAYVDEQTAGAFWLKDGTKYTLSPLTGQYAPPYIKKIEDANGNLLTGDMMNRSGLTTVPGGYQYTDSNGTPQTIQINYTTFNVTTDDCDLAGYATSSNPCTEATDVATSLPTSIVLPNGQQYTFTYNSPGTHAELSSMTLPTGATISYTYQRIWSNGTMNARGGVGVFRYGIRTRSESVGAQTNLWTYTETPNGSVGFTTTVEDPAGNCAVHSYGAVLASSSPAEQSVTYQNGCGTSATTARTVTTTYTGDRAAMSGQTYGVWNIRPTVVTTTLDSGQSSQVQTDYETFTFGSTSPGTGSPGTWMNPTEIREYDYGSTSPTRTTDYTYLHNVGSSTQPASQYQSLHIVNRVQNKTVSGSSGGLLSTTYDYDNYGSGISPSGVVDRDAAYGNWGNVTSSTVTDLISGNSYKTSYAYEDSGQIIQVTDPRNYATKYDYADTWNNAACALPSSEQGHIYLTSITNALQQTSSYSYNSCSGTVATLQDANLQTKNLFYDLLGRTTLIQQPDGGSTTYCYNDRAGQCSSASPLNAIDATTQMTASVGSKQETQVDGLGRKTRIVLSSDPGGADYVDTSYDGLGRVQSVSNPYRSLSDPTYGITSYLYDALGRKTYQCQPDNTTTPSATCVPTNSYQQWGYSGNVTTFTDENKNQWQRTADGLGRLTQVLEPSGSSTSPTLETDYLYDPLDNLTKATQHGTSSENAHVRTFNYDSLSRLLCEANPETSAAGAVCPGTATGSHVAGTTGYGYDANGNLVTKTDAMGNVTTQTFDALNRLKSQTYSTGDPGKVFIYDQKGTNTVGRLTYEASTGGGTLLSAHFINVYDPMGRIKAEGSCTITTCGTGSTPTYPYYLTYSYDLAGNLTTSSPGLSGDPVLTYSYNQAGQLEQITSSWNDATIHPRTLFLATGTSASSSAYSPFGTLENAQFSIFGDSYAPNLLLNRTYDNRGRIRSGTYSAGIPSEPGAPSSGSLNIAGSEESETVSAKSGAGSASITGQEQSKAGSPATSGAGSVTITGTDALIGYYPPPPGCHERSCQNPKYDYGTVTVNVGSYSKTVSYGAGTGGGEAGVTLASAMSSAINGDADAPVTTTVTTTTATSNLITLNAKTTGAATNYSLSASAVSTAAANGQSSFQVTPSGSSLQGGANVGPTTYDTGTVSITVNGFAASAGYGQSSTSASVASALATALNAGGSPVLASSSGGAIAIRATSGGSSTDYSLSASSQTSGNGFAGTSFPITVSGATLTGGSQAVTTYDSGALTVTVNNISATANYGQGSSPSSIASSIASAINSAASPIVTATANGASVSLTSTLAASSTNWPLTASVASSSAATFPEASFSVSASGMSGGADGGFTPVYSYSLNGFTSPTTNPGYDSVGNVVGLQDSVVGKWQFGYDTLNRLQSATGISGSFDGINVSSAGQGWTYDSFGNRTGQSQGSLETPTRWAHYGATNNQIAASDVAPGGSPAETVSYDGDGRLLNDGAKAYLWEMQGWLCGVTSAGNHYQYIYDAEGRLVTTASRPDAQCGLNTTTLADYIVDQFGHPITEADGSAHWRHTNVYANGELLATYDGAGLHYALNDWLGDKRVQVLASSTGSTVEETCWNLPFNDGFGCSGTGTDATEQHYTGKEHDKYVPQLDHFGARSYTQYSGRFLSPDPGGVAFSDPANPQSWNLYSYVQNNPLTNTDPDGHDCVTNNGDGTVSTNVGDCGNENDDAANREFYINCDGCTANSTGATLDSTTGDLYLTDANGNGIAGTNVIGFADPAGPSAQTGSSTSTSGTNTTIDIFGTNWQSTQFRHGTHPYRDNNPGDIISGRFVNGRGAIGADGRFGVFPSSGQGKAALDALLHGPAYNSLTVSAAIERYAPGFENNTAGYQQFIQNVVGVSGNAPLSSLSPSQFSALENGISRYEGFSAAGNYSITTTVNY